MNDQRPTHCNCGTPLEKRLDQLRGRCIACIIKSNNTEEFCPHCNANLQGEPIPKERQYYYGATHSSRTLAIYDEYKDRTVQFQCPDCNGIWDRI